MLPRSGCVQVVTSYGMSDLGITTWAPPGRNVGFMQRNFEVHVDNIDADLFGNSIPGGMFQCSNSALYGVSGSTHHCCALQGCLSPVLGSSLRQNALYAP